MRCACCGQEVPAELWTEDQIREIRLHRMAKQQGLVLVRSERCASHASGWCLYWPATVPDSNGQWPERLLVSPEIGLTLDGVEEFLTYGTTRAAIMEYLIRSYGPVFVKELIKHLPQLRAGTSQLDQE